MQVTYILLTIAVSNALLIRNKQLMYIGLGVVCSAAFTEHIINTQGLISVGILALFSFSYFKLPNINKGLKFLLFLCLIITTAGFILHLIAGFNNTLAFNKIIISSGSTPYSMYLNFDKAIAGLILYTFSNLSVEEKSLNFKSIKQTILILGLCIIVILLPAIITGYIKLDLKIPSIISLWAINNFFFVCFSEEVIFRGFLQNSLYKLGQKFNYTVYLAIIITSVIFGLAHYKSGITFIILAAICGLFYGYTYYKTNRILCAMLVHFGLNLFHFLIFTYPKAI